MNLIIQPSGSIVLPLQLSLKLNMSQALILTIHPLGMKVLSIQIFVKLNILIFSARLQLIYSQMKDNKRTSAGQVRMDVQAPGLQKSEKWLSAGIFLVKIGCESV